MLLAPAIDVQFSRSIHPSKSESTADPIAVVRAILALADEELDYARAKMTFDRVIDPSLDIDAVLSELDDITHQLRQLVGGASTTGAKLAALRMFLHDSGPWNDHRPFAYDQSDPLGRKMQNKLLHTTCGRAWANVCRCRPFSSFLPSGWGSTRRSAWLPNMFLSGLS